MRAELFDEIVTIHNPISLKISQKSHFGKIVNDNIELSLIEAIYLAENNKIEIYHNEEEYDYDTLVDVLKEKNLYIKYSVFKDLRNRGYIVKTGFKYGSEFRLYERGVVPGDGHSSYLVKIIAENQKLDIMDFSSFVRVAHGVNKSLMLAIVDEEGDITYYNVEWIRP